MSNQTLFRGIIPFSGGIDSTAVLFNTLTKFPNDQFLVFKVNIISSSSASRTIQEIAATEQILKNLRSRNIDNFEFRQLEFNYSSLGPPPVWDSEVVNYAATLCIKAHPEIHKFYEGAIADDFLQPDFDKRLAQIKKLLFLAAERSEESLEIVFPLKNRDKYEVMKSIPQDLLKLTWSCRYPRGKIDNYTLVRCNDCPPCNIINEVLRQHPNEFPDLEKW